MLYKNFILFVAVSIITLSNKIHTQNATNITSNNSIPEMNETTSNRTSNFNNFTQTTTTFSSNGNTEVAQPKPMKKKSHEILMKPKLALSPQQHQKYDVHPENFDFNLDDLEDVHESFKKSGLTEEEQLLLSDINNSKYEDGTEDDTVATYMKASSTVLPPMILLNSKSNGTRHIYKITKGIKSKTKSRELLKKDEHQKNFGNQFNSVDREFFDIAINSSLKADESGHFFPIIVNLFDHFYWQPSEIRTKVSPVCGVELLSYLSALDNGYGWALKAYDSSGRYRGQFLYGNSFWVGEKMFCEEINRNQEGRKHFEFGFYMAHIGLKIFPDSTAPKVIQLGECLPKSCNTNDVKAILELDPHGKMFLPAENSSTNGSENMLQVVNVRRVPGDYLITEDDKFQAFCGICLGILILIITASIYEWNLSNKKPQQGESSAPTENGEAELRTKNENSSGKAFELFQINAADNNNIEVEPEGDSDTKIKKPGDCKPAQANVKDLVDAKTKVQGFLKRILLCFALGTNAKAILSVSQKQENLLSCVHGIRVLSVLWTIMVHTYLQVFNVGENRFRRNITERSFIYQAIGNATFSVDSFFFISGLLVTLLFLRHQKRTPDNTKDFVRKGLKQSCTMIAYRYIRLTPSYLFVVFFSQFSLRYMFNRSVFSSTLSDDVTCRKYWWRNILYINNWYPFQELCMIWSWYLANDMQFYIMAIILLIISTRYFKASVMVVLLFLLTSWATSGIFSLHYHYSHKVATPFESFDFLYDKPWQRVGTYIIGMATGYIIYKVRSPPQIPFLVNILLWLASIGILFIVLFGVWDGQLDVLQTAFYVSIGHTAWGIGLVWITLSCSWGMAPPINKFLSYRGFLPLSRLTYCTYLVHPVIMLIISLQMEGSLHLEHSMILTIFLGNAALSFFVAFVISVSFEAPVIRLLKIIFR